MKLHYWILIAIVIYLISINLVASYSNVVVEEYKNYKENLDSPGCSYSTDGGITNISVSCDTNFTELEAIERAKFNNSTFKGSSTIEVKSGLSDRAYRMVTGKRWYGKIIDNGQTKNAYLLSFIRFPIENQNFNFKLVHLIFLPLLGILFLTSLIVSFINRKDLNIGKVEDG